MALKDKALLVSLTITTPSVCKKAKVASERVEREERTHKNQASVVAKLYAKDDIKGLITAAGEARRVFKELTLPWGRGNGILPAVKYLDFMDTMRELKATYMNEKQFILNNYDEIIDNARIANGDLFNINNYPNRGEIADSMVFSIEVTAVPSANDFDALAGLSDDELKKLKEESVIAAHGKVDAAIKDLFTRIFKSLEHAVDRLIPDEDGAQKIFRDSIIENIERAIEAAETLNITNNREVEDLVDEVKKVITGITPGDLRADAKLRAETADRAADLVKKINVYL